MDRNRPWDDPLRQARAEAAARLGLKDTPPEAPPYFAQRKYSARAKVTLSWDNPAEAIAQSRKGVQEKPDDVLTLNMLAWKLVTCPDPKFHDPPEAVRLAKRATIASW